MFFPVSRMTYDDDRSYPTGGGLGLIAAACLLALGIGFGGYYLGHSLQLGLKALPKSGTVTVKGLAERSVKADLALWPLRFVVAGNDLSSLQQKIESDQAAVVSFLKNSGLADDEIIVNSMEVIDKSAAEYQPDQPPQNRFMLYGNMMIRSSHVEAVQQASRRIGELIKGGVIFAAGGRDQATLAPYYLFTRLNDVKLEMLSEATRNARAAAEQLARDATVPLGDLASATQGLFSILPGDPMPGASEENQVTKTVRVVTTAEYRLAQ
jgi:hypothetical protein